MVKLKSLDIESSKTSIISLEPDMELVVSTDNERLIKLLDSEEYAEFEQENQVMGNWHYTRYWVPLSVILKTFIKLAHGES